VFEDAFDDTGIVVESDDSRGFEPGGREFESLRARTNSENSIRQLQREQ